jgi:porphobilinogen deaminase
MTVLGVGDRREVLVEGAGTLADVPKDTRVGVSTARQRALLRAHHPRLVPVSQGRADGPVIRPLWPEPELEAHGEVLEWESWLPAPGQGIPVLLHTDSDTDIPSCPEAAAVLTGERALARRFPQVTTCVLGQAFGGGIRIRALLLSADGRRVVRGERQGVREDVGGVARDLAKLLIARGAHRLLESSTN